MKYTLNYNKPPLHPGDEIELNEEDAKRLLRLGFISEAKAAKRNTNTKAETEDTADKEDSE